ncbi:hypothetical protein [Paenibacillus xylaniclasticus]|uniref:hypothetical protein n=1 Tax=Paenibacillus xylaniclasticus TaxID=588083 RepID=UPI00175F9645|nr:MULTISPECIES: hypothetical protein [Paenibacillus]GFN33662.1 hypothetical protein PCURB6_39220 [Paenibacillus curdlanolyticus]
MQGGATITNTNEPREGGRDNLYLFPNMLDHYQIQLTRMLEAEQFSEAKDLIRFLLQCRGEDERHYEEWSSLLAWLEMAFPEDAWDAEPPHDTANDEEDEEAFRRMALQPSVQDEAYVKQVLYIIEHHPMADQQMLALERAVHLNDPSVDKVIVSWLERGPLHPAVQFKALQCLRRRGASGTVTMVKMDETVTLDIEMTPLSWDDFPESALQALERVVSVVDSVDPTLPHFARELWRDLLQYLYGTTAFDWLQEGSEHNIDCWAGALHVILMLTVYGTADDDAVRDTYGISEPLRFRYEQACRSLRQAAAYGQPGRSPES